MQFITKLLVIVSVVVVANAAPINDNMVKVALFVLLP